MVPLPATAAIEYVAACLPGGTFGRGAYARSPQVQCVYAPSRLSVPSIVGFVSDGKKPIKQTNICR